MGRSRSRRIRKNAQHTRIRINHGVPFHKERLEKEMSTPKTPAVEAASPVWVNLQNRIAALESQVRDLTKEVEELKSNASKFKPTVDEFATQVYEFLGRYPGLKFNSGAIGENVDRTTARVSDKLRNMVNRPNLYPRLRTTKEEGRSQMFWYEPETEGEETGS